MSDSTSGYEIRTNILHMAIGIISENRTIDMNNQQLLPEQARQPVEGYTIEEVLTEAEKLYTFVKKK